MHAVVPAVEQLLDVLRREDDTMAVEQGPPYTDAPLDPTGGDAFVSGVQQVLRAHGIDDAPWFLTVGLVNPHDIMWFPIDQPWYREREPDTYELAKSILASRDWGRADNFPPFVHEIDRWFTELPANFDDDLHTKPEVHRSFMTGWMNRYPFMSIERDDPDIWLRQLDYYVKLHELSDQSLGMILNAMDDIGGWDDTVVIFTSDHGDQCGSHGLRSKGPWNYQETMRIPLYIVAPGVTKPGTTTHALTSAVDLAREIAEFAGVNAADTPTLQGNSMATLFEDSDSKVRDFVLFSQEWAWWQGVERSRYASSGVFDGRMAPPSSRGCWRCTFSPRSLPHGGEC